jgi:DNA-binding protein HU-beta
MTNKKELVAVMATKSGLTPKDSELALNAIVESITEFLSKKDNVQLIGFGTFETRERAAREGRNPQTGGEIKIEATTAPAFKAGKGLKDAVK